jgi:hypothetical protein
LAELEKRDDGDEIESLLRRIDDKTVRFNEQCGEVDRIRCDVETVLWERQKVGPHLARPVEDLELSEAAAACIPVGVETIGQLCEYTPAELESPESRYKNEIRDVLGNSYVLVLKPRH